MKRFFCGLICAIIMFSALTVNVSASDKTYAYSLSEYQVLSVDASKYTFVEMNSLAPGLRQYINDITAENRGCQVTIYLKYNVPFTSDLLGYQNAQAVLAVNTNCVGYLYQRVDAVSNKITFDWDTVLSKANWNKRQGLISDIQFGINANVTITGFSVYVPEQPKLNEIAAGEECYETTNPLRN